MTKAEYLKHERACKHIEMVISRFMQETGLHVTGIAYNVDLVPPRVTLDVLTDAEMAGINARDFAPLRSEIDES